MDEFHPIKMVWAIAASLAGSVTALSFRLWQKMSPGEVVLALVVGTTFAVFVTPLFLQALPDSVKSDDFTVIGGIYYLLASGWNILLPLFIVRFKRFLGADEEGKTTP